MIWAQVTTWTHVFFFFFSISISIHENAKWMIFGFVSRSNFTRHLFKKKKKHFGLLWSVNDISMILSWDFSLLSTHLSISCPVFPSWLVKNIPFKYHIWHVSIMKQTFLFSISTHNVWGKISNFIEKNKTKIWNELRWSDTLSILLRDVPNNEFGNDDRSSFVFFFSSVEFQMK